MLLANLWFDEMYRIRWPTQLDYIIHYTKWREQERQQKLPFGTRFFVNEFDRIQDQLSFTATVVAVLQERLEKMEESMFALKKNVFIQHALP